MFLRKIYIVTFLVLGSNFIRAQNWEQVGLSTHPTFRLCADTSTSILYSVDVNSNLTDIRYWTGGNTWTSTNATGTYSDAIIDIEMYQDTLYSAGTGMSADYGVNSWNNFSWSYNGPFSFFCTINSGTGGCTDLLTFNNELYATGVFDYVNFSSNGHSVAKFDGNTHTWINIGDPSWNCRMLATLGSYNGNIFAAGANEISGSSVMYGVFRYNGAIWDTINFPVLTSPPNIYSMIEYNNELYIAGDFKTSDGYSWNHIARWNGSVWNDVGGGFNGDVYKIIVHNNELYAVGAFTQAGNAPANGLAKWNGTTWCGSRTSSQASTITFMNDTLYIGGQFTSVNGDTSIKYVARCLTGDCIDTCSTLGIDENYLQNNVSVFPNPSSGKFHLRLIGSSFSNGAIEVYDLIGHIIYTSPISSTETEFDLSGFQSGIYFLKVKTENGVITKKIVKE